VFGARRLTKASTLGWSVRDIKATTTRHPSRYVAFCMVIRGRVTQPVLIDYIPATVMIPQRRFSALLHQARAYQRQQCIYHNSPLYTFSLYSDHRCNKSDFPRITTTILEVHSDEVWNIEWSHDGNFLASASKDKSAIIWKRGVSLYVIKSVVDMNSWTQKSSGSSIQDWAAHLILRDHPYSVGCLAWSLDDSILLTTAEHFIKMWNVKVNTLSKSTN